MSKINNITVSINFDTEEEYNRFICSDIYRSDFKKELIYTPCKDLLEDEEDEICYLNKNISYLEKEVKVLDYKILSLEKENDLLTAQVKNYREQLSVANEEITTTESELISAIRKYHRYFIENNTGTNVIKNDMIYFLIDLFGFSFEDSKRILIEGTKP
jgi:hypothetical protein